MTDRKVDKKEDRERKTKADRKADEGRQTDKRWEIRTMRKKDETHRFR